MDKAMQILDHAKLTGSIKLDDMKYLLLVVADKVLTQKLGEQSNVKGGVTNG